MDVVVHLDALQSDVTAGGCLPVDGDALAAALAALPPGAQRWCVCGGGGEAELVACEQGMIDR